MRTQQEKSAAPYPTRGRESRRSYRANRRADLVAQEQKSKAPSKVELEPVKRDAWLASIPVPACSPEPEDLAAAEDVRALVLAEAAEGEGSGPVAVAPFLARFAANLASALGGVARGLRVDEWETRAGMTYSRVNVLAKLDSKGFGALWNAAWTMRREAQAVRVREKAVERVVEGDAVPLVGRIHKDKDGIIGERRTFSDRLTEYLIDEAKPVEERVSPAKGGGAPQINVGQIVYNIPNLPADVAARILAPAPKIVDAQPAS